MDIQRLTSWHLRWVLLLMVVAAILLLPAAQAQEENGRGSVDGLLTHLSQGAAVRYLQAHPEQAPPQFSERLEAVRQVVSQNTAQSEAAQTPDLLAGGVLFNRDSLGLPQNEESITACGQGTVLGGTNDYRGLVDPQGNFTGWHVSTNGGQSVENEGLLPPVRMKGQAVESGGDPVAKAGPECSLYMADLNYDFVPDEDFLPNGIGVYKSDTETLANCPGGSDPSCWPVRKAVAVNSDDKVFLDKPWMYVGKSAGKTVVWTVYTEFRCPDVGCASGDYNSNSIKAVRCDADLNNCTEPILISGDQPSIQFGDVTIGPDGRTYITWEQDNDLQTNFEPPERMRFWIRVAEPGSTEFGPMHLVAREPLNLGIAPLHANDFRAATYPKNEVTIVNGAPRVFVTWEGCRFRPAGDSVCEEPQIKVVHSDDRGQTWSDPKVVSAGGDNYFPTISASQSTQRVAIAYYTNRFDPVFHNRQDVELVTLNSGTSEVIDRQRLTSLSNESEADPLLGGLFIGDYIEVFARGSTALVHYNANYRQIQLLNEGVPVPQQDNYLRRTSLGG
ncbi:MAG: hypothetical protein M3305_14440 [Actinomycetota bacterium]|nr:hypothetical protein [Actinomycetota bacterium]